MTVDVAITFDIEFCINGTFLDPDSRKPRGRDGLICRVNGKDAGLGHILDTLDNYGLRATFFVEVLQTAWFGDSEMADIAQRIAARGHELQLHLHPVWLQFENPNWKRLNKPGKLSSLEHDSLIVLPESRALEIIEQGKAVFARWGLPAPTAVRTGNLFVERWLYQIFARSGLMISSSIGSSLYSPRDSDMNLFAAPRIFDSVLELPVTSYLGAGPSLRQQKRLATVVGMGVWEQRALLNAARRNGVPCIVVLSHVSEFCSVDDEGHAHPNRLSARKFDRLCRTVSTASGLNGVTINELANKVQDRTTQEDIELAVPRLTSAARLLDQMPFGNHGLS